MKNNLTTTNQNAKLALIKSKSLLDITNKLLAKKDIGQLIQSFKFKPFIRENGHSSGIGLVAISPDGKTIVSRSGYGTIKLWDIKLWDMESGECLNTLKVDSYFAPSVGISPDEKTIVAGGSKVWYGEICIIESDEETIVYDDRDYYNIEILDIQSGKLLDTLKGHFAEVYSVAISSDGKTIVSGSWDGTIKVWDMESGECLNTLEGHFGSVYKVAISPDGKTIVSGGEDCTIKIWNMQSSESLHTIKIYADYIFSIAISPDGKTIVSENGHDTIKIWDIQSGKILHTLKGHSNSVHSATISPDGKTIVSGSEDGTIKAWDMESGKLLDTIKGHSNSVYSVAISSDGKRIVSGCKDGTIKVWDIQSGECIYTAYNINDESTITMFSDGSFNASEENIDKFIRIDDTSTSCRKLTKEEIEHFCKVKYENKNKIPQIDIDEDEIPF